MEEEFGRQRKSFMSQMTGLEQTHEASKNKLHEQIRSLEEKLLRNNEEMVSIQQKAQMRDNKTREAFDADRVKYEEEISSLKQALEQALKGQPHLKLSALKSPTDSLESSMTKAAEESKLLKLVVVPYEEEIDLLKLRLREAQERIALYEGKTTTYDEKAPLIDLHSPVVPERRSLSPTPEATKIQQLQRQLELERSAHFDIEMHTKELERQRTLLQDEVTKLQNEMKTLKEKLEIEEISYSELKTTWELANQQFIAFDEQCRTKISSLEQELARAVAAAKSKASEPAEREDLAVPRPVVTTTDTRQQATESPLNTLSTLYDECMATTDLQELKDRATTLHTRYRAEISRLETELSQTKTLCSNYEAQLHRVQRQFTIDLEEKDREVDRLRAEQEKFKAAIVREKTVRAELRQQVEEVKQDMKTKLEQCSSKEKALTQSLKTLKEQFTEFKCDTQRDVTKFTDERIKLWEQIETCKEEYKCLKLVQSQNIEGYGQAVAELETAKKEAEANLVAALTEVSHLQKSKTELEARLQNQGSQISAKEDTTRLLTYEKESLQKQLADLRQSIESMNKEKEEARMSKLTTEEKSKQYIAQQQRQIDDLMRQRDGAAQMIQELQKQVTSLKQQLQNVAPSRANNEQPTYNGLGP